MSNLDGGVKFRIDGARLARVAAAIGRGDGDLSECLAPDLKHVCEILARLHLLQELAPGVVDEMFEELIPFAIRERNRKTVEAEALQRATKADSLAEWQAAINAGRSPRQKDYALRMVELAMKVNGWNQAEAIRSIALQTGREEEDIRRVVTRSKKRKAL